MTLYVDQGGCIVVRVIIGLRKSRAPELLIGDPYACSRNIAICCTYVWVKELLRGGSWAVGRNRTIIADRRIEFDSFWRSIWGRRILVTCVLCELWRDTATLASIIAWATGVRSVPFTEKGDLAILLKAVTASAVGAGTPIVFRCLAFRVIRQH